MIRKSNINERTQNKIMMQATIFRKKQKQHKVTRQVLNNFYRVTPVKC